MLPQPTDWSETELRGLFARFPELLHSEKWEPYRRQLVELSRRSLERLLAADSRLEYLWTLILECPYLLKGFRDSEWILAEFINCLEQRWMSAFLGANAAKVEGDIYFTLDNRLFFETLKIVQRKLNRGRPKKIGPDFRRFLEVQRLMTEGHSKPEAVRLVAQEETRIRNDDITVEESVIFRSLRELPKRLRLPAGLNLPEDIFPPFIPVPPTSNDDSKK